MCKVRLKIEIGTRPACDYEIRWEIGHYVPVCTYKFIDRTAITEF
jgi:hypothetical protein